MLLEAAKDYGIDLSESFMVGDRISDIEAGKNAGCRTILISDNDFDGALPDHVAPSLLTASSWIVSR